MVCSVTIQDRGNASCRKLGRPKCLEPERWSVGCSLQTLELDVASLRPQEEEVLRYPAVAATTFMRGAVSLVETVSRYFRAGNAPKKQGKMLHGS